MSTFTDHCMNCYAILTMGIWTQQYSKENWPSGENFQTFPWRSYQAYQIFDWSYSELEQYTQLTWICLNLPWTKNYRILDSFVGWTWITAKALRSKQKNWKIKSIRFFPSSKHKIQLYTDSDLSKKYIL